MVSRAERSHFADWWWTVDRWLLSGLGALMVLGIVLTMAGSPAVAERLGLASFHFVNRQVFFLVLCAGRWSAVLSCRRGTCAAPRLLLYIGGMALVVMALMYGVEVKGAQALDLRHPAVGIREAGFRHHRGLGVLGRRAASRRARHADRHGASAYDDRAAGACSPTSARRCWSRSSGPRFSSWRACIGSGSSGIGGLGVAARCFAYQASCRMCARASANSSIRQRAAATRRHLSGRHRDGELHFRRLVRQGPGRGHNEAHPARQPHRFHLRRHGRGIRHARLHALVADLRLHRAARASFCAARNEDPFCRFAAAGLVVLFRRAELRSTWR